MARLLLLTALLAVSACSEPGTLQYTPAATIVAGRPATVASVTVADARDEKPNRLATIMGGFGNPFYVLDTDAPVATLVQGAFTRALSARGIVVAPTAGRRVQVTLRTLYADQYMGNRKAVIDLDVAVQDASGRTLYQDSVKDRSTGSDLFNTKLEPLRADVQALLSKSIDTILDRPGFRTAINPG